jgi:phosphate transport system substrate-binding protein
MKLMSHRWLILLVALLPMYASLSAQNLSSQSVDDLPQYKPEQRVSGTIRLWGHGSPQHDFVGKLARSWQEGFARYQPDVKFEYKMYGTASSIGALYAGAGDVAIRGEEIHSFEVEAFKRVLGYPPLGIEIATGSLDVRNMDFAFVVFVHKDNPLSRLTLAQLDAILGYEHRRGSANIRTWGQLGLTEDWADKPINVYSWKIEDDFSSFLQEAVLNGSHKWNCDIREFAHIHRSDGSIYDSGQQILDALAKDRYGIAISNLRYVVPQVKPLALAVQDTGPYYEATKQNLIQQTYPLTRIIPAFINRAPGKPVDPKVKEFLRYILSREGQQDIVREGGYLPLNKETIQRQLKKLE